MVNQLGVNNPLVLSLAAVAVVNLIILIVQKHSKHAKSQKDSRDGVEAIDESRNTRRVMKWSTCASCLDWLFRQPQALVLVRRFNLMDLERRFPDLQFSNVRKKRRFLLTGTVENIKRKPARPSSKPLGSRPADVHYDVALRFEPQENALCEGAATISFRTYIGDYLRLWPDEHRSIFINFSGDIMHAIWVNNVPLSFKGYPIVSQAQARMDNASYLESTKPVRWLRHRIAIPFGMLYDASERQSNEGRLLSSSSEKKWNQVFIAFSTTIHSKPAKNRLQRLQSSESGAWTYLLRGGSYVMHRVLPCFDQSDVTADIDMTVLTPSANAGNATVIGLQEYRHREHTLDATVSQPVPSSSTSVPFPRPPSLQSRHAYGSLNEFRNWLAHSVEREESSAHFNTESHPSSVHQPTPLTFFEENTAYADVARVFKSTPGAAISGLCLVISDSLHLVCSKGFCLWTLKDYPVSPEHETFLQMVFESIEYLVSYCFGSTLVVRPDVIVVPPDSLSRNVEVYDGVLILSSETWERLLSSAEGIENSYLLELGQKQKAEELLLRVDFDIFAELTMNFSYLFLGKTSGQVRCHWRSDWWLVDSLAIAIVEEVVRRLGSESLQEAFDTWQMTNIFAPWLLDLFLNDVVASSLWCDFACSCSPASPKVHVIARGWSAMKKLAKRGVLAHLPKVQKEGSIITADALLGLLIEDEACSKLFTAHLLTPFPKEGDLELLKRVAGGARDTNSLVLPVVSPNKVRKLMAVGEDAPEFCGPTSITFFVRGTTNSIDAIKCEIDNETGDKTTELKGKSVGFALNPAEALCPLDYDTLQMCIHELYKVEKASARFSLWLQMIWMFVLDPCGDSRVNKDDMRHALVAVAPHEKNEAILRMLLDVVFPLVAPNEGTAAMQEILHMFLKSVESFSPSTAVQIRCLWLSFGHRMHFLSQLYSSPMATDEELICFWSMPPVVLTAQQKSKLTPIGVLENKDITVESMINKLIEANSGSTFSLYSMDETERNEWGVRYQKVRALQSRIADNLESEESRWLLTKCLAANPNTSNKHETWGRLLRRIVSPRLSPVQENAFFPSHLVSLSTFSSPRHSYFEGFLDCIVDARHCQDHALIRYEMQIQLVRELIRLLLGNTPPESLASFQSRISEENSVDITQSNWPIESLDTRANRVMRRAGSLRQLLEGSVADMQWVDGVPVSMNRTSTVTSWGGPQVLSPMVPLLWKALRFHDPACASMDKQQVNGVDQSRILFAADELRSELLRLLAVIRQTILLTEDFLSRIAADSLECTSDDFRGVSSTCLVPQSHLDLLSDARAAIAALHRAEFLTPCSFRMVMAGSKVSGRPDHEHIDAE